MEKMMSTVNTAIGGVKKIVLRDMRRRLFRRVHTKTDTSETWSSVPDGYEVGDVELTIDLDKIARIVGPHTLGNKTGRSTGYHGAIRGRVVGRRKVVENE
jgi:hypothetical protein